MIYLDNGATSFYKPPAVIRAVVRAMQTCANPGRGGYKASMDAAREVFRCRELAGEMFGCEAEQVVFTSSCTHGLNIALGSMVNPGDRILVSGFEHNAVTRTLHGLGAKMIVAGRKLFDWEDTLRSFESALRSGVDGVVFTHVSNVFGYILPVREMAALCGRYGVPFCVDAAQSAGVLDVNLEEWGADFIAMPGHKGLLGPQGTGMLLCNRRAVPLLFGGTGSASREQEMPDYLPDGLEPGTLNVPGIAGLRAGLEYIRDTGREVIFAREHRSLQRCVRGLKALGFAVFSGENQAGTVSFLPGADCEEAAALLAERGIAVRAGLHCAPLAHESGGTLETGTVRVSFGIDASDGAVDAFLRTLAKVRGQLT